MIGRRSDIGAALAAFVVLAVGGCGSAERNLASNSELSGGLWSISVTSPAFRDGQAIPKKYTEDGENVSPPLRWSKGPTGTTGYVLMVEDPDAGRKQPAMHWLVYRIPVGTNELPENAAATGNLMQGKNYKGTVGYAGPNPPKGNVHHYHFQVFAIDQTGEIGPGATRQDLEKAALRSAIAKGELIGTYGR
jgi:Raf kinase inhibitor-like YbhB/YbcL family protein